MPQHSKRGNHRKQWGQGPVIMSRALNRVPSTNRVSGCSCRTYRYRIPAGELAGSMMALARQSAQSLLN